MSGKEWMGAGISSVWTNNSILMAHNKNCHASITTNSNNLDALFSHIGFSTKWAPRVGQLAELPWPCFLMETENSLPWVNKRLKEVLRWAGTANQIVTKCYCTWSHGKHFMLMLLRSLNFYREKMCPSHQSLPFRGQNSYRHMLLTGPWQRRLSTTRREETKCFLLYRHFKNVK